MSTLLEAADAEAICEAAQRPAMRFVSVKSEETQGAVVALRSRDLLIRQRTQTINALRGHLAEFGEVVPQGSTNASKLIAMVEDPQTALPEAARTSLRFLTAVLSQLTDQIRALIGRNAMAASGRRYRLARFETLLDDRQLLVGCPPPTTDITGQQFNVSIGVRHKPVLKPVLEPFCLCRLSGRKWGQFRVDPIPSAQARTQKPIALPQLMRPVRVYS
jgi:transposase